MTGKEFKEEQSKIRELRLYSNFKQARDLTLLLIKSLFQEHKFSKIVELFYSDICTPPEMFYLFEVAYALNELDYVFSFLTKKATFLPKFRAVPSPSSSSLTSPGSLPKATFQ